MSSSRRGSKKPSDWIEFPACGKAEPVKWWYCCDELRWEAPHASRILEARTLDGNRRTAVLSKARACRREATAKKERLLTTAKSLLEQGEFRGAAAASLSAYQTAPSDADMISVVQLAARTRFLFWTQHSFAWSQAEITNQLFTEYIKGKQDNISDLSLVQAGIALVGVGKKSEALRLFLRLVPKEEAITSVQIQAVLWCVALLRIAQRNNEALAYLSWAAENCSLQEENEQNLHQVVPRWIIHLLLAEASISGIVIKTSLREAQRLSVISIDGPPKPCLRLNERDWFRDYRVWMTAAEKLFSLSHFILAENVYTRAASLIRRSKKVQVLLNKITLRRAICWRLAHDHERSIKLISICLDADRANLQVRSLAIEWSTDLNTILNKEEVQLARGPQALMRAYKARQKYKILKDNKAQARYQEMCLWQKAQPYVQRRERRYLCTLFKLWIIHASSLLTQRRALLRMQKFWRRAIHTKFQFAVHKTQSICAIWTRSIKKVFFFNWCQEANKFTEFLIFDLARRTAYTNAIEYPKRLLAAQCLQRTFRVYKVRLGVTRVIKHSLYLNRTSYLLLLRRRTRLERHVFVAMQTYARDSITQRKQVAATMLQKNMVKIIHRRRLEYEKKRKHELRKQAALENPRYDLALVWLRCLRRENAASKLQRGVRCRLARKQKKKRRYKERKARNNARKSAKRWLAKVFTSWHETYWIRRNCAILIAAPWRGYIAREFLVKKRAEWVRKFEKVYKQASRHQQRLRAWLLAAKRLRAARGLIIFSRKRLKILEERQRKEHERLIKLNKKRRNRQLEVRCLEAWRKETIFLRSVKKIQCQIRSFLWRRRNLHYFRLRRHYHVLSKKASQERLEKVMKCVLKSWRQEARLIKSARRIATLFRVITARNLLAKMVRQRRASVKKITMALGVRSERAKGRCMDAWVFWTKQQLDAKRAKRTALKALDVEANCAAQSAAKKIIASFLFLHVAKRRLSKLKVERRVLFDRIKIFQAKREFQRRQSNFYAFARLIRDSNTQRVTDAAQNKSHLVNEFLFKTLDGNSITNCPLTKQKREECISTEFMAARRLALNLGVLSWQSDVLSERELLNLCQLATCVIIEHTSDFENVARALFKFPVTTPKIRTKQALPCQRKLILNGCTCSQESDLVSIGRLVAQGALGALTINQSTLSATTFTSLAFALMTPSPCTGLRELSIYNCNAGPSTLSCLLTALLERSSGGLPALNALSISGNRLDYIGYDDNAQLLRRLLVGPGSCPMSLILERMDLTPLAAIQIAQGIYLAHDHGIKILSLACNPQIQDEALAAIMKNLSSSKTHRLERLDLSDCGCGPLAASALLTFLEENISRSLSISLRSTVLPLNILNRLAEITGKPEARCVLSLDPNHNTPADDLPLAVLTGLKSPHVEVLQGHRKTLNALISNFHRHPPNSS